MTRIRDAILVSCSAVVVGTLVYAADARAWFQTMHASGCQLIWSGDAPYWDGAANTRVSDGTTGQGVRVICPVLEDDLHLKAGATLYVRINIGSIRNISTQVNACVDSDTGIGGSCSGTWFVPAGTGLQMLTVLPSQMPNFQTGYNYPYVSVSVGSRTHEEDSPVRLRGILLMK
jgi:hypothetical protein